MRYQKIVLLGVLCGLSACSLFVKEQPVKEAPKVKEPEKQPECFYHEVKYQGETLAAIAAWYTGDWRNWEAIVTANEGLNEKNVEIGSKLCLPFALVTKQEDFPKPKINFKVPFREAIMQTKEKVSEKQKNIGDNTSVVKGQTKETAIKNFFVPEDVAKEAATKAPMRDVFDFEDNLGSEDFNNRPVPNQHKQNSVSDIRDQLLQEMLEE